MALALATEAGLSGLPVELPDLTAIFRRPIAATRSTRCSGLGRYRSMWPTPVSASTISTVIRVQNRVTGPATSSVRAPLEEI
jgi:hypothetical protein